MKYEKLDFPAIITIIGGALMVLSFWLAHLAPGFKFPVFFAGLGLGLLGMVLRRRRNRQQ